MPRPHSEIPTYRRHRQSGQANVTVTLGRFGSAESKQEYSRIIASLEANHGHLPGSHPDGITINEVMAAFLRYADRHYKMPDNRPSSECKEYRLVFKLYLRPVLSG